MAKKAAPVSTPAPVGVARPQRTKEHINASKSHNCIEKFFIDKGHVVERPGEDYGYDVVVTTFDAQGYAESGDIRIQLKSSEEFDRLPTKLYISYQIKIQRYNLWVSETMPVFLILYEANHHRAYWIYVQDYFSDTAKQPKAGAKTLTIRVPVANLFTDATVDYARSRKTAINDALKGMVHHG